MEEEDVGGVSYYCGGEGRGGTKRRDERRRRRRREREGRMRGKEKRRK